VFCHQYSENVFLAYIQENLQKMYFYQIVSILNSMVCRKIMRKNFIKHKCLYGKNNENKIAYTCIFVLIIRNIHVCQSQISIYNDQNFQHFLPMLLGVMWLDQDYSAGGKRIFQYNTFVLPTLKCM